MFNFKKRKQYPERHQAIIDNLIFDTESAFLVLQYEGLALQKSGSVNTETFFLYKTANDRYFIDRTPFEVKGNISMITREQAKKIIFENDFELGLSLFKNELSLA